MAITMFSIGTLLAPLSGLLSWLAPVTGKPATPQYRTDTRPAVFRSRGRVARPLAVSQCRKSPRPLRVFRARGDAPAPVAIRMAMSGSMADVCAELERLAALEATAAH